MIAADGPDGRTGKLLLVGSDGVIRHSCRNDLALLFGPGDAVIVNDAATLPASLHGIHVKSGDVIEIRLAGWIAAGDPTRFVAIAFGRGDHRTPTEERSPPPRLSAGDRLQLGPLRAVIERSLGHPRLLALRFHGDRRTVLHGLARHGRPIQYAHVPAPLALWDVWTSVAVNPIAFEPPSAGFALDWQSLTSWRRRGVKVATLTHAAGISSTGDPELDRRLPFDEPYVIPKSTAETIEEAKAIGGRIVAIGTTVARALESAAMADGRVQTGEGMACGRIGGETQLRVVDAILTGMHEPGESHFELLRAFADEALLLEMTNTTIDHGYRSHEFGDSMLIERQCSSARHHEKRHLD